MKSPMLSAVLVMLPVAVAFAGTPAKPDALHNGMIKVAVVVSDHANLMDIAGPWEVFQDTMLKDDRGNDVMPFELYTVAPGKAPIHTVGSNRPGIEITPDYSFADAPTPDIVVVGAQSGGPGLDAWLRKIHAERKVIMSVCTGAFKLGEAGLLNGKQATTHHWYFGSFAEQFPKVKLVREVRYVQADPITFTAGGLTSGVDLALHIVAERFGQEVAQQTADYMEYLGTGWKTNHGISELTTPVTRQDWSGRLPSGDEIVLHMITRGASHSFTTDIPAQKVTDVPTKVKQHGKEVSIRFAIPGRAATFTGQVKTSGNDATGLTGTFVQDGKLYPLSFTLQ